ncbi:MAG: preprotein translocase subunit SecY [Clostridiales bacterium]|nr:preprotein translocase subunit SecY [Clostridiales bacterium]
MFKTLADAFKIKEVRNKLILTLVLLFVYRLGCWLPIPGIDVDALGVKVEGNTFLNLLSSVSGGSLAQGSFLALGVSPYITSSIVIQLLAGVIPAWQRLAKEGGADGRKKISQYTKIAALLIAVAQAIGIAVGFGTADGTNIGVFGNNKFICYAFIVLMLVAGAMFTVWLGEKITEIGIGNGMSLLIFVGVLSSAGTAILTNFQAIGQGGEAAQNAIWQLILFLVVLVAIFALVVFVDGGERKVPVQYAKQMRGRKMYGGQSTYIPVRVNANGVMPIIFASTILTFPQMLFSMFWPDVTGGFIGWWNKWVGAGSWVYAILLALLILAFAYFYTMMNFDSEEISRQIQQNGGFIQGIRPGRPTAQYLNGINKKITLFGAIFLAFMALIPTLLFTGIGAGGLNSAFSATGMLIVVSVALEFDKQLEAQMMMRNYRGFLK